MSEIFTDGTKDRKRRFLRGLNFILGLNYRDLGKKDILLRDAFNIGSCRSISKLREKLADIYCLEFTKDELVKLLNNNMTTGDFTEKYCRVIYGDRGDVDINTVIGSSVKSVGERLELDFSEMGKAPKYGLNGPLWCDVAKGFCSCGAGHK